MREWLGPEFSADRESYELAFEFESFPLFGYSCETPVEIAQT